MHLSLIAATLAIGASQAVEPQMRVGTPAPQVVYQWFLVPGSGICRSVVPIVYQLPAAPGATARWAADSRSRQELHIVIETDDQKKTERLAKKVLESLQKAFAEADLADDNLSSTSIATCPSKKGDPKQVIDPVMTGY